MIRLCARRGAKGVDAGRGDYSAFVRLGVDREGILYVQADLARCPTPQIVADEFAAEFRRQLYS